MIAPDANLLIHSYSPASPFHDASRVWLETVLSSSEPVGIPIHSITGFLRYVTHVGVKPKSLRFSEAADIVNSWLALPHVRILYPGDRHWLILQKLAEEARLRGAQITDATIAAIAQEYGAVVHTNDRDFHRFPGVRWLNPLRP